MYGFMICVLICICVYVGFGDPLYVFRQWFSPVYERVSALTADPLNTLDTYIIIWDNGIYREFMCFHLLLFSSNTMLDVAPIPQGRIEFENPSCFRLKTFISWEFVNM